MMQLCTDAPQQSHGRSASKLEFHYTASPFSFEVVRNGTDRRAGEDPLVSSAGNRLIFKVKHGLFYSNTP